jgi:hypothetical protein
MRLALAALGLVLLAPAPSRAQDAPGEPPPSELAPPGEATSDPPPSDPGLPPDPFGDEDAVPSSAPPPAESGAYLGEAVPEPPSEGDEAEPAPPLPRLFDLRLGEAGEGHGDPFHAWASFGFFSGRVSPGNEATVIAPSLGVRLAITEELDASLDWALAYGATRVAGTFMNGADVETPFDERVERVEAGNPTLGITFTHAWGDVLLQVGGGIAIPAAAITEARGALTGDDERRQFAAERAASILVHDVMLAMNGGRDAWLYLPERLSFMIPVRVAFGSGVVLGAIEAAGAWTITVLGGTGGSEAALQLSGELAFDVLRELRAGARVSVAGWGLGGSRPRAQPAIEPWLRVAIGPAFGMARVTIDAGGDYGFGSANGPIWAVHVGGGAALER